MGHQQNYNAIATEINRLVSGPMLLLIILCTVLWFYAGLQTWRLMFLLDPEQETCELTEAYRQGEPPMIAFAMFLVFWPLLLFIAFISDAVEGLQRVAK